MKRLALIAVCTAALVGCATHPIPSSEALPVPTDRVFAFQAPTDKPSGTLVVVRDKGFIGGGCPMAFYVDGTLAAHLRTGESTMLIVPAGSRILGAGPAGAGMCQWGKTEAYRREAAQLVTEGTTTKIRLAITHEGVIQVTPTAF